MGGDGGYDGSVVVIIVLICRERTVGGRGGKIKGDNVERHVCDMRGRAIRKGGLKEGIKHICSIMKECNDALKYIN